MPKNGGLWDEDLWTELDVITDPVVRNVLRKLYRMILEMYSADQLAKAVAEKVSEEVNAHNRHVWTIGQKSGAFFVGLLVALDTALSIVHML